MPPYKKPHQYRHERYRKERRGGHRKGLCVRERLKEPPFLGFQREYGHERDRDDQKGEKERRPYLFRCIRYYLPVRLFPSIPLDMLVRVFYHDYRAVYHCAYRYGNASKAHDIGVNTHGIHYNKGNQDTDREHYNGNKSASEMEKEDYAYEGDHDRFLYKLLLEGVYGPVDKIAPVIY